jgi:hypothetical protein
MKMSIALTLPELQGKIRRKGQRLQELPDQAPGLVQAALGQEGRQVVRAGQGPKYRAAPVLA